ncbi:MAG: Omp28 family outer membrane lipoprotein [bacterium]|jgi:hypothetical protein
MKRYFGLIIITLALLTACDKVEPPYVVSDTGGGNGEEVIQKVLLEDYTGHDCVNCPTAAEEAHNLHNIYGDQLIIMAVHAGWFARPIPEEPSLSEYYGCETGEAWYNYFQAFANPIGMVNRVQTSPGNHLVEWGEWGSEIAALVENTPEAKMSIENNFNTETKKLETKVTTQFLATQNDPFSLMVCITQDSIIGGQKNNDPNVGETPLIEEYVFMHVLRASMNGDWGESLTDAIEVGTDYEKTYSIIFPDEWIPEHCHVIAFVYNEADNTILQVEDSHVTD